MFEKSPFLFALFFLSSCGTIIHGTRQDIGISSNPSGANVTIDNIQFGKTPVIAKLAREDNHTVKIEQPGFQPFDATITNSVSGWVWGNIILGGLIGLAVDAVSGGLYYLSPEQVNATLTKET